MCPPENGIGILPSASPGDQRRHCSIPKDEPHSPVYTGVAAYIIPNSPSQADLQAFQLRSSLNPHFPHLYGIISKFQTNYDHKNSSSDLTFGGDGAKQAP